MITGRSLSAFRGQMLRWFQKSRRDLPWRGTRDPYRVWLSEIMLQQTRVAAVVPYYQRFLQRFPHLRALADAPQEEVLRLWSGLGYYSRARNLQLAAQRIVAQHGGKFPRTEEEILALPGIGRYTKNAILSIAMGKSHAVLDGNVARVLARIHAVRGDLRETRRWKSLQKTADHLLDPNSPGDWNQAMMELGATICTPRAPQCPTCPAKSLCRARQLGIAEVLPEKREKRANVNVILAAAVLLDANCRSLLLAPPKAQPARPTTRPSASARAKADDDDVPTLVSKMWHFPAISVRENAATELRCFLRKLLPAIANVPVQLTPLSTIRHTVTYRRITVLPFCVAVKKLPRLSGTLPAVQIVLSDLSSLPVSNLTRKIARAASAVCENSLRPTVRPH
jgi:A/G-specific adenine glycosylase